MIELKKYLFEIITLPIIVLCFFMTGFQFFVLNLPSNDNITLTYTEGIIVTTGGDARIKEGLNLLSLGVGKKMLVTGVGKGITKQNLLRKLDLDKEERRMFLCCTELDYSAEDTKGNAKSALDWLRENDFSKFRLVTANYHFPRALLEFEKKLKNYNIEIKFWPVNPPGLNLSNWYVHWPSVKLLLREYLKYLFALFSSGTS